MLGIDHSPVKESHERQMSSDRHPATVGNKQIIIIVICNIRTLNQSGQFENIKHEMIRFKY